MAKRYVYWVKYQENGAWEDPKGTWVIASSKEEAYDTFMDEHNWSVYSAWVDSVTYMNGKYRKFNTFAGKPY